MTQPPSKRLITEESLDLHSELYLKDPASKMSQQVAIIADVAVSNATPGATTDGFPPSVAPTFETFGGAGSVFCKIDASEIDNHDPLRFKLYYSTVDGFTPGPTNLYAEDSSTLIQVVGLDTDIPYYFRVSAVDDDGEGPLSGQESCSAIKIDVEDFAASVTAAMDAAAQAAAAAQATADSAVDSLLDIAAAAAAAQAAADNATSLASDAQSSANTAYNEVSSKGRIIIQPTTPLSEDRLFQNLWIDTTSIGSPAAPGNVPKRWNGTAWVSITDKVATDAANAAVIAKAAADSANAAALLAKTSADGKTTIVYSGTDATNPTSYKLNDTWMKFTGGLLVGQWRHDGSAWVSVQLDNAVIGNLDAGKIATGFLNVAVLIQAGAISTDKLAVKVIEADEIYTQSGYIGTLTFDQMTGGTITSTALLSGGIWTALSGARAGMSGQNGIQVFDAAGSLIFNVPTMPNENGELIATLMADMVARSLLVMNGLTIRGVDNELSKGATLTLAGGTTTPGSSPTPTFGYDAKPIYSSANQGGYYLFAPRGLAYAANQGVWLVAGRFFTNGQFYGLAETAGSVDRVATYDIPAGGAGFGVAVIGNKAYVLVTDSNRLLTGYNLPSWWVYRFDLTSGLKEAEWAYQPSGSTQGVYSPYGAMIGVKGTNVIIAQPRLNDGTIEVREYNPANGTQVGSTLVMTTMTGFKSDLTSVQYGNFDFGSARYVVTASAYPSAYVANASGVYQASESFPLPVATGVIGFVWDATKSVFRAMTDTTFYDHTNIAWTAAAADRGWIAHSWYDSNVTGGTHETKISKTISYARRKRAQVIVSTPPLPESDGTTDAVTGVRIYHGQGMTQPVPAAMFRDSTDLPDGVIVGKYKTLSQVSGSAQANLGTAFLNSTPATVIRSDGTVDLDGAGTGSIQLAVKDSGLVIITPAQAAAAGFVVKTGWSISSNISYRIIGKSIQILFQGLTRTGSLIAMNATGNTADSAILDFPPALLPAMILNGLSTVGNGRIVSCYVNNSGNLWLGSMAGTSDFAVNEIISIGGTYQLL